MTTSTRQCNKCLSLPTYVTYVEFHQDLIGPSVVLTTQERCEFPLVAPGQQGVVIRWSVTPDWRLVREGQQELRQLAFELLEVLDDVQIVWDYIPQFRALHSE